MTLQRTTMTLQEQARQSGLVLLDEIWNHNDWPALEGGWLNLRYLLARCDNDLIIGVSSVG